MSKTLPAPTSIFAFLLYFFAAVTPLLLKAQSQTWVPDPLASITNPSEGAFSSRPEPIHLVGPRNGYASGSVVVRGATIDRPRIQDLSGPGGDVIPADQIQVRFMVREISRHDWEFSRYDALLPGAPTARLNPDQSQPIWITVKIPPNIRPGTYQGELMLGGLRIPINLEVGAFLLPDPHNWTSHAFFPHSPEAIAWTYGETLYSEGHWEKMIPSLRLLGALGNNVAQIPVQRRLHIGNDHSMVVFREEGNRVVPDFRFVEKYLDLYEEHIGIPRVINLYWWEHNMPNRDEGKKAWISFINERGQFRDGKIDVPGGGQHDQTWKDLISGMRALVRARGWDPSIVMIGTPGDNRPEESIVEFFNAINPPLQWVIWSHWRGDPVNNVDKLVVNDMNVGYAEGPDPPVQHRMFQNTNTIGGGWKEEVKVIWATTSRGTVLTNSPPTNYRFLPDMAVIDRYSGLSRIGLDGWSANHPEEGNQVPTLTRFRNNLHRLWRGNPVAITAPGPDGAVATVRYEMLREGYQEAEARIILERALRSDKLSSARKAEIREFLKEWFSTRYGSGSGRINEMDIPENWRELTLRMFNLAAEIASESGWEAEVEFDGPIPVTFDEAKARDWTSAEGQTITAQYLDYRETGVVLLMPDQREVIVPLNRLSNEDRQWVREASGFRIWTNRAGQTIEARLLNIENGTVLIERLDGATFPLPINTLSDDDQAFINQ